MSTKQRRPGGNGAAPSTTGGDVKRSVTRYSTRSAAQEWAAAWLAGPHTEPDCATCSAGWALIGRANVGR